MRDVYLWFTVFLLLNIIVGLVRVVRGPAPADRMVAAQLFGTTGVAIMLVIAEALEQPAIRTVGLIFAVLAVFAAAVFVRRTQASPSGPLPRST